MRLVEDRSRKGWTCPGCGRGVAPGQNTCDHGHVLVWPWWNAPVPQPHFGGCDACRHSGICMCVRPYPVTTCQAPA